LRVLSIDGGGIRGLMPALVLEELERRLGAKGKTKPLYAYLDLIAGTSTGGFLAAGLTSPQPQDMSRPAATPADLVALFADQGGDIFDCGFCRSVRKAFARIFTGNLTGVVEDKYTHSPLEEKPRRSAAEASATRSPAF
jgi:patatin-like phospholipase/acyl hydrolase